MHKQMLYVVKKTKILNKENHNNEVYTTTETNMGALLYHFKIYTSNRQSMNENINLYVSFIIFSVMTLTLVAFQITVKCKKQFIWALDNFPDPAAS